VSGKGSGFVIAASGLRAEARIAARSGGVRAVAGVNDTARLDDLARQWAAQGGEAIISFGIAAGLVPQYSAGACLIGREVVFGGASYSADPAWTASIKKLVGSADVVRIAGVDRPLAHPSEKQALCMASGAAAADMESHLVARIAAELVLPFAILRVIADPAERELPPAALSGLRADGRLNIGAVLASLAKSPRQLPAVIRLAAEAGRAGAALLRCSDRLGPRLGFRDLS
jgi:hopanoid-associated phosphorylase